MQDGKDQAVGGGGIGTAAVPRAGIQRDQGVDADAEANGNGVDHVLHRVHQRKRVMACSLIWATKKLSTMLYSAFTVMESTMGSAMETSSGKIGRSFIKVSFTGKV